MTQSFRRCFCFGFATGLLVTFSGCLERNVETRAKLERGREKINVKEELEEFGKYDKYRDKLFRERFMENVESTRADRRRHREVDQAMKDGSLLEKYSEKDRRTARAKDRL